MQFLNKMESFLKEIRGNTYSITPLIDQLQSSFAQYKNQSASDVNNQVITLEKEIEDVLKFSSEGIEIPVYTFFSQKVVNEGCVFGRSGEKSWEAEK